MQRTDFVATLFHGRDDPARVTVAFTMALAALGKGHSATLVLMVDAVHLGRPGATDGMDIGKPFDPVSVQLEVVRHCASLAAARFEGRRQPRRGSRPASRRVGTS